MRARLARAVPVADLIRVALPRDARDLARLIDLANRTHSLSATYVSWPSAQPAAVRSDNLGALRLFERAGFRAALRFPHQAPGLPRGYRGMVRMCRDVR